MPKKQQPRGKKFFPRTRTLDSHFLTNTQNIFKLSHQTLMQFSQNPFLHFASTGLLDRMKSHIIRYEVAFSANKNAFLKFVSVFHNEFKQYSKTIKESIDRKWIRPCLIKAVINEIIEGNKVFLILLRTKGKNVPEVQPMVLDLMRQCFRLYSMIVFESINRLLFQDAIKESVCREIEGYFESLEKEFNTLNSEALYPINTFMDHRDVLLYIKGDTHIHLMNFCSSTEGYGRLKNVNFQ